MFRPIVQCRWIKVCTVRPNERVNFGIDLHFRKKIRVEQRFVERAPQDGFEIDYPAQPILKADAELMWAGLLEAANFVNGMFHCNGAIGTAG